MTNKAFYEFVINANLNAEVTAKAKALLNSVEKKSESKSKASELNAKANLATFKELAKVLRPNVTYAISEVKAITKSELNSPKLSAIFREAEKAGLVNSLEGYKVGGKGRAVKGYILVASEGENEGEGEGE